MHRTTLLETKGICKSFGPTHALTNVDITIRRGDILGLIGENGSGKSTFSAIVAGALHPDSGTMLLRGEPYKPSTMVHAQSMNVSMVVQEMGTLPRITVSENIFVGNLHRFKNHGFLDIRKMNSEAAGILKEIGAEDIQPEAFIDQLNFEDRKIVELARAMYNNPDLLIIDETTTALAQKGRTLLYRIIEKMNSENKAVLFISHDLDELMEVCNTVTVLRDGFVIDTLEKEQMSIGKMRSLMVGRELQGNYYRADYDGSYDQEVVLEVNQVTSGPVLENFCMQLHKGEILGIGGLANSGMHELGRVIFGIDKPITGEVILSKNKTRVKNPLTAIRNKMGYVSKDRDKEALIINATIRENIVLSSLRKLERFLLITSGREKTITEQQIESMSIKCNSDTQLCRELSGGNKQKVVFAKWLAAQSDILILDCPTRGIDVGVKANMYALMNDLKKRGRSIVMISEELPELIGMSDRIMILKDGTLTGEFTRSENLSEHMLIEYMI